MKNGFTPRVDDIEQTVIDCWRAASHISTLEIEHLAPNGKAILEARDYLDQALTRLHNKRLPK